MSKIVRLTSIDLVLLECFRLDAENAHLHEQLEATATLIARMQAKTRALRVGRAPARAQLAASAK